MSSFVRVMWEDEEPDDEMSPLMKSMLELHNDRSADRDRIRFAIDTVRQDEFLRGGVDSKIVLETFLTILELCGDIEIQIYALQCIFSVEDVFRYKDWFAEVWFKGSEIRKAFLALHQTVNHEDILNFLFTYNSMKPPGELKFILSLTCSHVAFRKTNIPKMEKNTSYLHLNCGSKSLKLSGLKSSRTNLLCRGYFVIKGSEIERARLYRFNTPCGVLLNELSIEFSKGVLSVVFDSPLSDVKVDDLSSFLHFISNVQTEIMPEQRKHAGEENIDVNGNILHSPCRCKHDVTERMEGSGVEEDMTPSKHWHSPPSFQVSSSEDCGRVTHTMETNDVAIQVSCNEHREESTSLEVASNPSFEVQLAANPNEDTESAQSPSLDTESAANRSLGAELNVNSGSSHIRPPQNCSVNEDESVNSPLITVVTLADECPFITENMSAGDCVNTKDASEGIAGRKYKKKAEPVSRGAEKGLPEQAAFIRPEIMTPARRATRRMSALTGEKLYAGIPNYPVKSKGECLKMIRKRKSDSHVLEMGSIDHKRKNEHSKSTDDLANQDLFDRTLSSDFGCKGSESEKPEVSNFEGTPRENISQVSSYDDTNEEPVIEKHPFSMPTLFTPMTTPLHESQEDLSKLILETHDDAARSVPQGPPEAVPIVRLKDGDWKVEISKIDFFQRAPSSPHAADLSSDLDLSAGEIQSPVLLAKNFADEVEAARSQHSEFTAMDNKSVNMVDSKDILSEDESSMDKTYCDL